MSGDGELSGSPVGDDGHGPLCFGWPCTCCPVLPPVVPDSEPTDPCKFAADYPTHHHHLSSPNWVVVCTRPEVDCYHDGVPLVPCPVASGVVPDKPALAPEDEQREFFAGLGLRYPSDVAAELLDRLKANASVPAVTDDEAATEALALALRAADLLCGNGGHGLTLPVASDALRFLAALRANGYSLVRSTREDT